MLKSKTFSKNKYRGMLKEAGKQAWDFAVHTKGFGDDTHGEGRGWEM